MWLPSQTNTNIEQTIAKQQNYKYRQSQIAHDYASEAQAPQATKQQLPEPTAIQLQKHTLLN